MDVKMNSKVPDKYVVKKKKKLMRRIIETIIISLAWGYVFFDLFVLVSVMNAKSSTLISLLVIFLGISTEGIVALLNFTINMILITMGLLIVHTVIRYILRLADNEGF